MVLALRMMWLGSGISLTLLGLAACWGGAIQQGWFDAVVAGVLGAAVFATAFLANLPWLRWVAAAWWVGELLTFALRHRPEAPLVAAVMLLLLLAGPGVILINRQERP